MGVDGKSSAGLALGFVDGGVGAGVDDHIGGHLAHRLRQTGVVTQIAAQTLRVVTGAAGQCDYRAQRGQAALQLPAHLAVTAEQQNLHAALPACA